MQGPAVPPAPATQFFDPGALPAQTLLSLFRKAAPQPTDWMSVTTEAQGDTMKAFSLFPGRQGQGWSSGEFGP